MVKIKFPEEKLGQIKETIKTSAQTLKLVWGIDKWLFLASMVSNIIPAIIPFINIYIYKLIIDLVVKTVGGAPLDLNNFYPLIALRIATYFIQDLSFNTQNYIERLLWTKVPIELNQLFYGKITNLDIQYFENDKFRDLMDKARESIGFRPQNLVSSLFYSLQSLVQFGIAFVTLIKLNPLFVLLVAVVAIPEFISQTLSARLSWGIWGRQSPFRRRYDYLVHIMQGPREAKEVRLFTLAKKLLSEIKGIQENFYQDNKKIANRFYKTNMGLNFLSAFVFVGIEVYIVLQALARKVTIGDISFYTGVVTNFQNGLGGLLRNLNQVWEHSLYVKNLFDILEAQPLVKQIENPIKLNLKKAPRIEFKNITFRYPGTDKNILQNFSLVIKPGEKVAFVGENGAGKSTIIKLLARFYDVDQGEILIDDVNIRKLDLEAWYHTLGILFQDFNRYEHTVKENIYFGKVHESLKMKKIIEAATSAGAHSVIAKFPQGYEQILGKMFEGGIELSGGQWQKIALSRAFFRNAPILVLDEPTASIDARAEAEIFAKVEKLSKNKTVIIVSHRFSTVRNADKIYVVDRGKIVEAGSHEQLMKLDGQYATLFKLQAKGYQ